MKKNLLFLLILCSGIGSIAYGQSGFNTGIGFVCDANFSPFSSDKRLGMELSMGYHRTISESISLESDLYITSTFKAFNIDLSYSVWTPINMPPQPNSTVHKTISFQSIYFNLDIPILVNYRISKFNFGLGPVLYCKNVYTYRSKDINGYDPELVDYTSEESMFFPVRSLGLGYCMIVKYHYSNSISPYIAFKSKIIDSFPDSHYKVFSIGIKYNFSSTKNPRHSIFLL